MAYNPSDRVPDLAGCCVDCGRIEIKELLGSGSFGKVFRAIDVEFNLEVAVKVMVTPQVDTPEDLALRNELALHKAASSHPNVVGVRDSFAEGPYVFVVLDLCGEGDLFEHIHNNVFRYFDPVLRKIVLQIIDGLAHCHGKGVYHRDLKPENILCSRGGDEVYLADFGLATQKAVSRSFGVGTSNYMAPECLREDVFAASYYPELSDLWSLGLILIKLLTGRLPWDRASSLDPHYRAFIRDPHSIAKLTPLPLSRECVDLIRGLLATDPMARIALEDLRTGIVNLKSFYDPLEMAPQSPVARYNVRSPVIHSPVIMGGSDDTDSDSDDEVLRQITIRSASPASGALEVEAEDRVVSVSLGDPESLSARRYSQFVNGA